MRILMRHNLFERVIYELEEDSVLMTWGYRPPSEDKLKDFSLYAQELEDLEALYKALREIENSPSRDLRRISQAYHRLAQTQGYKIFVQRDLDKPVTAFNQSGPELARYSIIPWEPNFKHFRALVLEQMINALLSPLFNSYTMPQALTYWVKISGDLKWLREKVETPAEKTMFNRAEALFSEMEAEFTPVPENNLSTHARKFLEERKTLREILLDIRLVFSVPKISELLHKNEIRLIKCHGIYSIFFSKKNQNTEFILDAKYPEQEELIRFMDEFKLEESEIEIYLEHGEVWPRLLSKRQVFQIQKPLHQIIQNARGEGFPLLTGEVPSEKHEKAFEDLECIKTLFELNSEAGEGDISTYFVRYYTALMNLEFTYPNCAIEFSPKLAKAMRKKFPKGNPENMPQSSEHLRTAEPSKILQAPLFKSLQQRNAPPANLKIKALLGEEISKIGFRVERPVRLIYAISELGEVIISHHWSDAFKPTLQEIQQFSGMDVTRLLPTKLNGKACLHFSTGSDLYYFDVDTLKLFAKAILLKHHHLAKTFISAGYLYISNGRIAQCDPSGRNGVLNHSPQDYSIVDYQNEIITTLFEQHGLTVSDESILREEATDFIISDREHKLSLPTLPNSSSNRRLPATPSPEKLISGCNYQALNYGAFQTFEYLGLKIYAENSAAQFAIKQAISDAVSRGWSSKSVENLFWLARHATKSGNLKIFGLDAPTITPTTGSITWHHGDEIKEIRLSTQEATWVMKELVHESAHATLELCNPHRGNTSEWRLLHEQNIIKAFEQDLVDFQTPQTLTAAEKEVANMIFEKPKQYSSHQQTAERISSVLHCMVNQEDIVHRVAPRLGVAVQEYVAAEIKLPMLTASSQSAEVLTSHTPQSSTHLRAPEPTPSPNPQKILDAITVPYRNTDLPGATVHHGTVISQVESVISGPQNVGWGFGGKGLYIAVNEENLAVDYAGHALQSAGLEVHSEKAVLLEGILNPHKEYRVACIQITRGNANLEKGIFPADWAKIPGLQDFMLTHFDMIEVRGAANANCAVSSNRYLVIHESAAPDVVKWTQQIPLSNREIQLGRREALRVNQPNTTQAVNSSSDPSVPQVSRNGSPTAGALPVSSMNSPSGAPPVPRVNSASGTLPPAKLPPHASASSNSGSLLPREIIRTIQIHDVPIQGETGTLEVKLAAVRNANGTVQNPRVVSYQFKPDWGFRLLGDLGAGFAGAATGFNIAVYYNESKQRNPELAKWEHGYAAVGITAWQGGIWCALSAVGSAYLTVPLGMIAFAGGGPDMSEITKMAWGKVDPAALHTMVFNDVPILSRENLAQMTHQEIWALTPAAREHACWQKVLGPIARPINKIFEKIGDAVFEMRNSGLPNMEGFHPESSVFIPSQSKPMQPETPTPATPKQPTQQWSGLSPFGDFLHERMRAEIPDSDGNVLFRDQDGVMRPPHEFSQQRNYSGLRDGDIRSIPPQSYPNRCKLFDPLRTGQLQLSFQNFDKAMISITVATSWKTMGISLAVLAVWETFLFFKHKSEQSKYKQRKRNTNRVNDQCNYADHEVNETIDACQAASDAFARYQAETNPTIRETQRLEFIKALGYAESLNTKYQTTNQNRVYEDVRMPTGEHEHNVRHRTRSHIRNELLPIFEKNTKYLADLRQQIPFETLRGNLLTHTSTSSDLLDKKAVDCHKSLLTKAEFIAAVAAHEQEAKNILNEALILKQQNPTDETVNKLVTSVQTLIQEELKTSPTYLQTTLMRRELFVMATTISSEKMSDADRKNFLDSAKEFKEQWDLLTDKLENINYLQQFADYAMQAGEYSTVQTEALALLSLDDNNFHAYELWIGASLSQETPQPEILAKISEAQKKFVESKQQGILGYYEGVIKNDVNLVISAFNQLKTTSGIDVPGILLSCIDEIKRNALERYQNNLLTKKEYSDLMSQLAADLKFPLEKIKVLLSENQDKPELVAALTKMQTAVESAKQQFPQWTKQNILHHQSTVMVGALNSIHNLLKKDSLSDEQKAEIKAELLKFSEHWNEFEDQINHMDWLENHADFAMQLGWYAIAQQDAVELLEKAPTRFHGAELWIESSKKLELADAVILHEIDKFKEKFLSPNELGKLCFQRGLITKALEDFQEAFDLLKQNFSVENSKMLQYCFNQFEAENSQKRVMDVELSRKISEDSMLLPQRFVTLEFLLKSLEALRAEKEMLAQLKVREEGYDFAQKRLVQLDKEIKECENATQQHARTSKSDLSSVKNQEVRKTLQNIGFAHLAFDVFAVLEWDVWLAKECGLEEPQMHAQNWRQIGSGIFNGAKKHNSDLAEHLGNVGAEKLLTTFKVRTPEQIADLEKSLKELNPENTNTLKIFFENKRVANSMLAGRLVEALVNYGLQIAYLHSHENRSYEEWAQMSLVAWSNFFLSLGLDAATSVEVINALVLVATSATVNPLDLALAIMNVILQTPLVSRIILDNIEPGKRCSESRFRIILGSFIQTMNVDLFHKFSGTHSSSILKISYFCMGDALASKFVQHAASLTGILRLANFGLRLVATVGVTAPAAERKRRLHNATLDWRQELDDAKKYSGLLAQHIFGRIKNSIEALSGQHKSLSSLYVEALFLHHQCADQIEIGKAPRDGNGLFFAVSQYAKETPAELRMMAVKYIKENADFFRYFIGYPLELYLLNLRKPGVPADALVIHALSSVLRRPIILAFLRKNTDLDFKSQGLLHPTDFPTGKPIYVAYNPVRQEYSSCLFGRKVNPSTLFSAPSLDTQIQKRQESLKKKGILRPQPVTVEPTKTSAELQRENAVLDDKIKSLRLRLLGKGLNIKMQDSNKSKIQTNVNMKNQ